MSFLTRMKSRARRDPKKLVLPEGTDIRMIKAAKQILDQDYASSVVLLGDPEEILRRAATEGCSLEGVSLELPGANGRLAEYTSELHRLRKHKGLSVAEARACIVEPLNWGAMMVRTAAVDAMVAGADCPTAQVLRSALAIIKTRTHTRLASSYFVMHLPDSTWGMEGYMLFSDCAMNPDPDAEQLAEIAVSTADTFQSLFKAEPVAALLSFSTRGSASHPMVDKVVLATQIAKQKRPDLRIDGELQLDAALVPSVADKKAPHSPLRGRANVLIFPDLNSGNIGYKLVQRLAGAEAYGPFIQGLARPVSDLSRGCTVEDVVNTAVVTLVQAQQPFCETPKAAAPAVSVERSAS